MTGAVTAAPGTYPVHLEVTDGTETKVFDRSVVVTRESATATYDGDTSAAATHGGPDAVEVLLGAAVAEVPDGTSGSLTTATATFTDLTSGDVFATRCRSTSRVVCRARTPPTCRRPAAGPSRSWCRWAATGPVCLPRPPSW